MSDDELQTLIAWTRAAFSVDPSEINFAPTKLRGWSRAARRSRRAQERAERARRKADLLVGRFR